MFLAAPSNSARFTPAHAEMDKWWGGTKVCKGGTSKLPEVNKRSSQTISVGVQYCQCIVE